MHSCKVTIRKNLRTRITLNRNDFSKQRIREPKTRSVADGLDASGPLCNDDVVKGELQFVFRVK